MINNNVITQKNTQEGKALSNRSETIYSFIDKPITGTSSDIRYND
jgi:hypothetical protein